MTTKGELPRPVYIARCVRSSSWWGVDIADADGTHVKGGYTQARRLGQVEDMVREVISLLHDVPEDSFDVQFEPELRADVRQRADEARALRQQDTSAESAATRGSRSPAIEKSMNSRRRDPPRP
jgi:hypothetical protein